MKNIRTILSIAVSLLTATLIHATTTSADGSVTASASMTGTTVQQGNSSQFVTFNRNGQSNVSGDPVTWTEATLWYAQGGYRVLGNQYAPNIFGSNVITGNSLPAAAIGTCSVQLRVVLQDYRYVDDWTTFNVTSAGPGGGV